MNTYKDEIYFPLHLTTELVPRYVKLKIECSFVRLYEYSQPKVNFKPTFKHDTLLAYKHNAQCP